MAEYSILSPRPVNWRMVVALIAVIFVPCALAAWLSGWNFFSFPLGTFLIWLGVPLGLVALVAMIPSAPDDEASES